MFARTLLKGALMGAVLTVAVAPGTAGAQSARRPVVVAGGQLVDFATGRSDPTDGATGRLVAVVVGGGTHFWFIVTGIQAEPGRTFGAHVHVGACAVDQPLTAGPHYRSDGITPDPAHEVWLDLTVLPGGVAISQASVPFVIPDGAARSVVIHAMPTGPGGVAGPRLACLPVAF